MASIIQNSRGAVVQGPTSLKMNFTLYEESIIASYSIQVKNHKILVDNVYFSCWGVATAVFDWFQLKKQMDLYTFFTNRNLEFQLSNSNSEIIDQSPNYIKVTPKTSISRPLNSTNHQWLIAVGYNPSLIRPSWLSWMISLVIIGSAIIAFMLMVILVEWNEQRSLLYYLVPSKFISRLQRKEVVIEKYDNCTIFVAQIIGFTALTGQLMPAEILTLLNQLYNAFDHLAVKYNLVKVETMGDTYVVIGAGPEYCSSSVEGAEKVALFGLDVVDFVSRFKAEDGVSVYVRAGIASGQIVAGVIGSISTFPKYTLFGDTLNFASLLQSTCKKMKIQCSEASYNLFKDSNRFEFKCRERSDGGAVPVGASVATSSTKTWWLNGVKAKEPSLQTVATKDDTV